MGGEANIQTSPFKLVGPNVMPSYDEWRQQTEKMTQGMTQEQVLHLLGTNLGQYNRDGVPSKDAGMLPPTPII